MALQSKSNAAAILWLFSTFLWLCTLRGTCPAQAPPTVTEALQKYHVEITEESLLQALHSPQKEVRGLAAAELAELKFTPDLPDIIAAARTESDPLTQVNIAAAATWLGSDEGLQIITGDCRNQALPPAVRIVAARNAFDKQDHTCFSSLIDLMRPEADRGARIEAMSTASQIKPKTAQEAQLVLDSLLLAINDRDLGIKLEACDDLRRLDDPRALDPLRRAIGEEQDKELKQQMQSSLTYLERSHPK